MPPVGPAVPPADFFWPPPVHFGLARESHLFTAQIGYMEARTRAAQFTFLQDEINRLEVRIIVAKHTGF